SDRPDRVSELQRQHLLFRDVLSVLGHLSRKEPHVDGVGLFLAVSSTACRPRMRPLSDAKLRAMRFSKYVKFREEKFGGVLFETRSEKVYTLNEVASAVVREIRAGGDERIVIARFTGRLEVSEGRVEREARAFI